MMDFYSILEETYPRSGETPNPYAGKTNGVWIEGTMSIDWLNEHFGEFDNVEDMIEKAKTMSEGTVLFFEYLKEQGLLN